MTEDQIKEAAQAIVAMRLRKRPVSKDLHWRNQMTARRLIEGKTYNADPIEDFSTTLDASKISALR